MLEAERNKTPFQQTQYILPDNTYTISISSAKFTLSIASEAVFQVYLSVLRLKAELVSVILIISLGQASLNNISIFSLFHFQFVSRSRRHAHVSVHSVNYNSDGRFFFDFREQVALVVMLAGFANHQTKTPGRNKKEGIHYNLSLQYEFSCFILHVYFLDSGFCA